MSRLAPFDRAVDEGHEQEQADHDPARVDEEIRHAAPTLGDEQLVNLIADGENQSKSARPRQNPTPVAPAEPEQAPPDQACYDDELGDVPAFDE